MLKRTEMLEMHLVSPVLPHDEAWISCGACYDETTICPT